MENTLEGNRIIAEFMGVKYHPLDKLYYYGELMNTIPMLEPNVWKLSAEQLKYHSSWDWLMPVVEKIEGIVTNEGNIEVFIFKRCCDMQTASGTDHIIEITGATSKIEAVWLAVIEFIKWYNQNKK